VHRHRRELLRRVHGSGLSGAMKGPTTGGISRRRLLQAAAAAAAAWRLAPGRLGERIAHAQLPPGDPLVVVPTLEAFADTLIPGEKRFPTDRAIAGAAPGAGGVQAGALALMALPAAGVAPALPALAAGLNVRAVQFAAERLIVLDPTVPPLVSLGFAQRTDFLVDLIDGTDPERLAWYALAGLVFIAYHTAGHLPTVDAIASGHPGLAAIGFPAPQADGLWRFSSFSYGRPLAKKHRRTTRQGNPR
jgi:hypothetical protein